MKETRCAEWYTQQQQYTQLQKRQQPRIDNVISNEWFDTAAYENPAPYRNVRRPFGVRPGHGSQLLAPQFSGLGY